MLAQFIYDVLCVVGSSVKRRYRGRINMRKNREAGKGGSVLKKKLNC
jgi:hypothetical protein